jgi:hypothetical protein
MNIVALGGLVSMLAAPLRTLKASLYHPLHCVNFVCSSERAAGLASFW